MKTRTVDKRKRVAPVASLVMVAAAVFAGLSYAGPREQAKRIHDRLAGVPPSAAVLDTMAQQIANGNVTGAADTAMNNDNFYNVTLKNFVTPWTNEDQTVFDSLNDYTATVIGMIRDDLDFSEVLSADIVYVGNSGLGLPPYSMTNNNHYEAIESQGLNLKTVLVRTTQSAVTDLPPDATAGVLTTRAAAKAFFVAGTNRAMLRFTFMNHLCNDLEQIKDTTRPPDRIRQDVTRSPGGDSRIFLNACVGCHSGMDPLAQSFAYYDWDEAAGRIVYNSVGMTDPATGTRVKAKYHINANNFPFGYVTPDDHWTNYWRSGPNALLGWDANLSGDGNGAKSMGTELANSDAFAQCQVKKVFKAVCLRDPGDSADRQKVSTISTDFKFNNYNVKRVFAQVADYCKGD